MAKRPQQTSARGRRQPAVEAGEDDFTPGLRSQPELIVVAKPSAGLRATSDEVTSVTGRDLTPLTSILNSENISLRPLFGVSEERLQAEAASHASAADDAPLDL